MDTWDNNSRSPLDYLEIPYFCQTQYSRLRLLHNNTHGAKSIDKSSAFSFSVFKRAFEFGVVFFHRFTKVKKGFLDRNAFGHIPTTISSCVAPVKVSASI